MSTDRLILVVTALDDDSGYILDVTSRSGDVTDDSKRHFMTEAILRNHIKKVLSLWSKEANAS